MDIIILDTSIFIKENFFHGKKINSFLNLSKKGIIELYITEITYNELKSNISKFLDLAILNHKHFMKDSKNWIFRNNKTLEILFDKKNKKSLESELLEKLDKYIEKRTIKIIPYITVDIKLIFDKYFNATPPFGLGEKKSEFPDAFSLQLIKDFLVSNGLKATIFSTDNDFISCSSATTEITNEYEQYLNTKFTQLEKFKTNLINTLVLKNQNQISEEYKNWYNSYLSDESLYHKAVKWKEIYDISVDSIDVQRITHKIINIEDDVFVVEITSDVKVKVSILTDDEEFMYYDSDDKTYHYLERNYESFEKIFESRMILSTEIVSENFYFEDFEIESINEGIKVEFDADSDFFNY